MGEIMDREVFDVLPKKKEDKSQVVEIPDMIELESDQIQVTNNKSDQLQRTRSHLSSSSDEEIGEGGERKRKKKKGVREKVKDSIKNDRPAEEEEEEKMDYQVAHLEEISSNPVDEKKGFLEKIKEILPGQQEKSEEDDKDEKSLMEKIKEKLGGGRAEEA